MAEVGRNAYATTSGNAAAGSPNIVAVVNDGTADRQIVVVGDPTTAANIQAVNASGAASVDTELPAAAALADGASNPTAPAIGSFGMVWNGASWERQRGDLGDGSPATGLLVDNPLLYNGSTYDRLRGDTTSGAWVNVKNSNVPITGYQAATTTVNWTSATTVNTASTITITGSNTVSVAMSNTSTMTAGVLTFEVSPDNTNWFAIAMARIDSYTVETSYTLSTVANRAWSTSVDGFTNFRVRLSTVITGTGTATISITPQTFAIEPIVSVGQATAANLQATIGAALPVGTNTIGAVYGATRTTGSGLSIAKILSAATTNATSVKASLGAIYGYHLANTSASWRYFRVFAKASAPTMGTDSPLFVLPLPPGGGAVVQPSMVNMAFPTGFAYAITGGAADLDATAIVANDVVGTIWYI